jgi:hypothetical protein
MMQSPTVVDPIDLIDGDVEAWQLREMHALACLTFPITSVSHKAEVNNSVPVWIKMAAVRRESRRRAAAFYKRVGESHRADSPLQQCTAMNQQSTKGNRMVVTSIAHRLLSG